MSPATDGGGAVTGGSNAERIAAAQEAINRRDYSGVRALSTEDTVCHFPDGTIRGADAIVAYFDDAFVAIPDRRLEILVAVETGDDVITRWRMTGTQDGPFGGLPGTGKPLCMEGFEHFVMRDGKMVSSVVITDQLALARQIGLVPAEGSGPDRAMKAAFGLKTRLARRLRGTSRPAAS